MIIDVDNIKKYVINLPERSERLIQFKNEFDSIGWTYLVSEGVIDKNSRIGISKAHQNAIIKAKNEDLDYIMVCEDDLLFTSTNKTYLYGAFNNIPEDFDILLLGVYSSEGLTKHNEYWNETKVFTGLTSYIMSRKAFESFASNIDYSKHIDKAMIEQFNYKCYVLDRFMVKQSNGFSDNVKRVVNYDSLLHTFKFVKD